MRFYVCSITLKNLIIKVYKAILARSETGLLDNNVKAYTFNILLLLWLLCFTGAIFIFNCLPLTYLS